MHQNKWWKIWLVVLALVTAWYICKGTYVFYQYTTLNAQTKTAEFTLAVEEVSSEKFLFKASYSFIWRGQRYVGEEVLSQPVYRNTTAAINAIPAQQSVPRKVWFSTSNPQHSTLQIAFPLKECLTAFVICGLFLYFLGLGYYVKKLEH